MLHHRKNISDFLESQICTYYILTNFKSVQFLKHTIFVFNVQMQNKNQIIFHFCKYSNFITLKSHVHNF